MTGEAVAWGGVLLLLAGLLVVMARRPTWHQREHERYLAARREDALRRFTDSHADHGEPVPEVTKDGTVWRCPGCGAQGPTFPKGLVR